MDPQCEEELQVNIHIVFFIQYVVLLQLRLRKEY